MSKNDSLPRLAYDDRNILLEGGIVGDQAIHRFGIRRFYNELPGKIEAASGIIRKFMRLGMSFEKALSEAQECIQLSNNSVQYLKEKFS